MKYFNNDKTSYFIDKLKKSDRCLTFSFSISGTTITVDSGYDIKQVNFSTSTPDSMLFELKPYASGETAPTWMTDGSTKYMVFGNVSWSTKKSGTFSNYNYYGSNACAINSAGADATSSTYPLFYFNVTRRSSYYQNGGNAFSNFSGSTFRASLRGRVVLL